MQLRDLASDHGEGEAAEHQSAREADLHRPGGRYPSFGAENGLCSFAGHPDRRLTEAHGIVEGQSMASWPVHLSSLGVHDARVHARSSDNGGAERLTGKQMPAGGSFSNAHISGTVHQPATLRSLEELTRVSVVLLGAVCPLSSRKPYRSHQCDVHSPVGCLSGVSHHGPGLACHLSATAHQSVKRCLRSMTMLIIESPKESFW